jgi:hypothetical protein
MKQRQQCEVLMVVKNFGRYVPVFRTKLLQLPAGNNCGRQTLMMGAINPSET